jgi:hypothetical protein
MKTVKTLICASAFLISGSAFAKKTTKKDAPPPAQPQAQPQQQQPQQQHAKARDAGSVSMKPTVIKQGYPSSFVHRPLTLPEGMVQADSAIAISNYSTETGTNMNLGFDVGVHPKLQTGLLMSLPLTPNGGFGMMVGNVQYGIAPFANLRFDVGATRLTADVPAMGNSTVTQDVTGFVWGAGVPMKWQLADRIAVTTGRTNASAFGVASKVNGYLLSSDDIVTMQSGSFNLMNGSTASATVWTFGLPVGMIVQPHDRFGLGFRTGFRLMRGDVPSDTAIPLAFDAFGNVARPLDLGVTFEMPGWTSDYGAVKNVNVWAAARF